MNTTAEGRPVFSRGAVISWARSIGIPDNTALEFMRQEGALIIDGEGIGETAPGTEMIKRAAALSH